MPRRPTLAALVALPLILSAGCPAPQDDAAPGNRTDCTSDSPRIGAAATLVTRDHGVSGTARIADDCTIVIDNFNYDGRGVDVRVYAATAGQDFADGVVLSGDLRRSQPYIDETLTLTLPAGATLDDVDALSVWCVPVGVSFGDATFPGRAARR